MHVVCVCVGMWECDMRCVCVHVVCVCGGMWECGM